MKNPKGAGRKKGSNSYGESTALLRVPESLKPHLDQFLKTYHVSLKLPDMDPSSCEVPFYLGKVQAGFPTPTDDNVDKILDLNRHLIPNPLTTFFLEVNGDSMIDAHILEGDTLIVDRALKPKHKDIVIAVLHGDLTVKRLLLKDNQIILQPENQNFPPIPILNPDDLTIWGVVTSVIHKLK